MQAGFVTLLSAAAAFAITIAAPVAAQQAGDTAAAVQKPRIPGQNLNGMHVYIRAGLKTHGPGQHDYPQFLADWSKLLTTQGAVVDGSLHAPLDKELEGVDVMVIYKGDAGYMDADEKAALDRFVQRGGGLVLLHDAMCGPDPADFAQYAGGAKKHGEVNYTLEADIQLKVADGNSPIMKGVTDLVLPADEAFYRMTWAEEPKIHVLATSVIPDTPAARRGGGVGQTVPQVWTYERTAPGGSETSRAFVYMLGHNYANFANPQIRDMILRGISWAAHHPVDELVDYQPAPPPARPGQRG